MIIIVEGIFTKWQHEECNIGVIGLLEECFKDAEMRFYGTRETIENLKSIGMDPRITTSPITIPEKCGLDKESDIKHYLWLLCRILKENHADINDRLVFLSCNKSLMAAALMATRIFHKLPTYLVCHGFLEQLLYSREEQDGRFGIKRVMERLGRAGWIRWISFSPFTRRILNGRLSPQVLRKMYFLHHPMLGEPLVRQNHDQVVIGVYGACVKGSARYFIKAMHDGSERKNYVFKVLESGGMNLGGTSVNIPSLSNTRIVKFSDGYSRQDRLRELQEMDFILLPYTKDQYRVSMSGILADAVRYEIPVIAYDSPIISWYGRWLIGVIGQDTNDLIKKVDGMLEHPCESRELYISNIRRMKEKIAHHNRELAKRIFG